MNSPETLGRFLFFGAIVSSSWSIAFGGMTEKEQGISGSLSIWGAVFGVGMVVSEVYYQFLSPNRHQLQQYHEGIKSAIETGLIFGPGGATIAKIMSVWGAKVMEFLSRYYHGNKDNIENEYLEDNTLTI